MCVTGHQNVDEIDLILRFSRFAFYLFASLLSSFQKQHEGNCFFKTQRVYHRRNSMHAGSVVTRINENPKSASAILTFPYMQSHCAKLIKWTD